MPMPKITDPSQIALSEDGKVKAKRLVKVVKPYHTVPDFHRKAVAAAVAARDATREPPDPDEQDD